MPLSPPFRADETDLADLVDLEVPPEDFDAPFPAGLFDCLVAAPDLDEPLATDRLKDLLALPDLLDPEDLLDPDAEAVPVAPLLAALFLPDADGFAAVVFLVVVLLAAVLPPFDDVVFELRAAEEDLDFEAPLPADFPSDFAVFDFEPATVRDPSAFSFAELVFVLRAVLLEEAFFDVVAIGGFSAY